MTEAVVLEVIRAHLRHVLMLQRRFVPGAALDRLEFRPKRHGGDAVHIDADCYHRGDRAYGRGTISHRRCESEMWAPRGGVDGGGYPTRRNFAALMLVPVFSVSRLAILHLLITSLTASAKSGASRELFGCLG
jgi:hypothetical protein